MDISFPILDHYYLELRDGSLAVVTGNWHTGYCVIGYVKYIPASKPSIWSRNNVFYERLVKQYNAELVHKYTTWKIYIPFFDSPIPCIPIQEIRIILNPLRRTMELLSRIKDNLEKRALDVILDIDNNVNVLLGITGSILPGIHSVEYSDMDFIIYGLHNSEKTIEYIRENIETYKSFTGERLENWIKNTALSTRLSKKDVLRFYRNWRRGIYQDREYSFIYNNGIYGDILLMPGYKNMGVVKAVLEVNGGLEALNYPSKSLVSRYKIIESQFDIPYDIDHVLSYEALYVTGLYEGGLFEVKGLLQCSSSVESCRIILGVVEYRGYMKYYE